MVSSSAPTVTAYLSSLPAEKRQVLEKVREVILKNLPTGYEEGMQYGMISYFIPLEQYPHTYNGQALAYAGLAAQKNYFSLYLMCVYGNPEQETWFKNEYAKSGKKLDMGKSCVRFKSLEELPLDLIGKTIAKVTPAEFIEYYEAARKK